MPQLLCWHRASQSPCLFRSRCSDMSHLLVFLSSFEGLDWSNLAEVCQSRLISHYGGVLIQPCKAVLQKILLSKFYLLAKCG